MMGRAAWKYPQEIRDFITENVAGHTSQELADMVNARFGTQLTKDHIKSCKTNWRLKSGTPCGLPKGHPSSTFPQEVCDYIRAHYVGVGHQEMADRLNAEFGTDYTARQINTFYGNHKLNSGRTGRFKKGHIPANKGKKGVCAPGCEKTQFKKGNLPGNTKPLGYERISKDGYIEVKIKMRPSRPDCNDNFVMKHRLIWEQTYCPIPKGYVVIFKDGDKRNFDLSNLALVSMAERLEMTRHGLFSKDAALTEAGIMVAKVRTTVYRKRKSRAKPPKEA